ncbi:MAG TPA: HD domain-containing phosphohydrolase [Candidatus Acidoferrales bacterium]|nr:HD domain-containing phosphohydrolase [Candidatus Acidoferrales bacterium]
MIAPEIFKPTQAAEPLDLHIDGTVAKRDLIESLLATLEACSPGAREASRRAGKWCERIAIAMDMSDEEITTTMLVGTLHDVGTIATPRDILNKPGHLSNDEWEIVRGHAARGAEILDQIPSLCDLAPAVRAHHERFDGFGYPDGIAGSAIPIAARIVAVADAFQAMVSERPYRRRMAPGQAVSTLMAGRGSQWDPAVIDRAVVLFAASAD